MNETTRIAGAAAFLKRNEIATVKVALVLGSGLKGFARVLHDPIEIPFHAIPHWPVPRVEGHGGALVLGHIDGVRVACLTGRVHLYEGFDAHEVVRALRSLRACGVPRFVLTNAAGGIAPTLHAGDLMVIEDHLNLTGHTPLAGAHEPALGPRFPDMSSVWSKQLGALLVRADPGLKQGVYAGLLGPSYETPAEVRMLHALGADAVGMSTVLEAIALKALGAEVTGLSLISNLAAGIADTPLSHDEVIAAGKLAEARTTALLSSFCASLATESR